MLLLVLAKAALKNGASNVEPAPARVGLWPPGPMLGTIVAEVLVLVVVLVLLQAATARTMIATTAAQMAGELGGAAACRRAGDGLTWLLPW